MGFHRFIESARRRPARGAVDFYIFFVSLTSAHVRDEASAAPLRHETRAIIWARGSTPFDFCWRLRAAGQQSQASADLFAGTWTDGPQGSGYRFRLIDEGGKININRR
jgi:hypothetical protein